MRELIQTASIHLRGPILALAVIMSPGLAGAAEPAVLVTVRDPSLPLPAGGSGDSGEAVLSPDGRLVLFSSAAPNLLSGQTNSATPVQAGVGFNLYLRDLSLGTNVLLTSDSNGLGASDGWVIPVAISTNGRYALFESEASRLVQQDTNLASDIFLQDLVQGTTLLISANPDGFAGHGASHSAAMTPDGRYVVFASVAADLVPGDTNEVQDIFLRDVETGQTTLVSEGLLSPALLVKRHADAPLISADGRYILYSQLSRPKSGSTTEQQELYLRDNFTGTTLLASAGAGEAAQVQFGAPGVLIANYLLSENGQHVIYLAGPTSLTAQGERSLLMRWDRLTGDAQLLHTNATPIEFSDVNFSMTPDAGKIVFVANPINAAPGESIILVWDGMTGTTSLVSASLANQVPEEPEAFAPFIDATGRFVVFLSSSSGLVTNNIIPGAYHVYLRDLETEVTTLVDASFAGEGAGVDVTTYPQVSAGGRFVVFHAPDGTLVPNDVNGAYDVFLRDMPTGTVQLLSSVAPGWQNVTPNQSSSLSPGSTAASGSVVFTSSASDLVTGDTNAASDVFVRSLSFGTNVLVSVNTNGVAGNGNSSEPWISGNGRYVVFTSYANDLVAGVKNSAGNVYLRDLLNRTTLLISADVNGIGGGDRDSYAPVMSADGRFVIIQSLAGNLVASSPTTANPKLFLRDLQLGTTTLLDTRAVNYFAFTPDGRYAAYAAPGNFSSFQNLYIWDTSLNARIYTNALTFTAGSFGPHAISPDGRFVIASTTTTATNALMVFDRTAATNWFVADYRLAGNFPIQFGADNQSFIYVGVPHTAPNAIRQVFQYDLNTRQNTLISTAFNSATPGNDDSDSPSISPDGRFIAYRSLASDLVSGDTNDLADIFVYDQQTGTTLLLTMSRSGPYPAFARSSEPMFSADGEWLFIQSFASDLVANDYNNRGDIFAYRVAALSSIPVFHAHIAPSAEGVSLTWPVVSGKTYRVQVKTSLGNGAWQDAAGEVTTNGNQGTFHDAPAEEQRFYRVVAF